MRVLPLSPALLALAATLFSAIAWMARHPTHADPGKINELLHPNMTGDVEIAGAYDLSSAIALALGVDAAAKSGQIERPQEVNG